MKVVLAGAGAFGIKHLDGIRNIDGVEVVSLIEPRPGQDAGGGRRVRHRPCHHRSGRSAAPARRRRRRSCARPRRCTPSRRWRAWRPASTCRSKFRWPTARRMPRPWSRSRRRPGWWRCAATRAASTHPPVGAQQDQRRRAEDPADGRADLFLPPHQHQRARASRASWTDHLLWHHAAHTVDLFRTRPASEIVQANGIQGPPHPELGIAMDMSIQLKAEQRRDLHAVPVLQQRRPAGHVLPLHLRQRHLHRALRRPVRRQGKADRRVQGGRVDERHRAAGPRVLRRDPRRARAELQRGPGAATATGCLHELEQQLV